MDVNNKKQKKLVSISTEKQEHLGKHKAAQVGTVSS